MHLRHAGEVPCCMLTLGDACGRSIRYLRLSVTIYQYRTLGSRPARHSKTTQLRVLGTARSTATSAGHATAPDARARPTRSGSTPGAPQRPSHVHNRMHVRSYKQSFRSFCRILRVSTHLLRDAARPARLSTQLSTHGPRAKMVPEVRPVAAKHVTQQQLPPYGRLRPCCFLPCRITQHDGTTAL